MIPILTSIKTCYLCAGVGVGREGSIACGVLLAEGSIASCSCDVVFVMQPITSYWS